MRSLKLYPYKYVDNPCRRKASNRAFTHDDRYDDRFANLCKVSGRSLADCISMVLTARVDFTKYYYYYFFMP